MGGDGAWPSFETTRPATHSDTSAAGAEGAGGPGCGAHGRRRGLAELRDDAPIRICHRAPLGRETGYPGGGTHTVGPGRTSHSNTSAAGMEGAGGHGGPGCGARGRRRGLAGLRGDAPSHAQRHKRRRCGGCRRARRARLRGPWAAAGPGRASRRRAERSSRRGRLAGGPPPTGTPSSQVARRPRAHQAARPQHAHTRTRPHAIQA